MTATLKTSDAGIQIERSFAASPERVFEAIVTPSEFSQWFGGFGVDVPVDRVSMDARPGGQWSAVMVITEPVEMEVPWQGEYREVVPGRTVVFTLDDNSDPDNTADETVCIHLRPEGDGTSMFFEQAGGGLNAEQYAQAGEGWVGFLESLAEIVESDR